jgi:hypothetical protein
MLHKKSGQQQKKKKKKKKTRGISCLTLSAHGCDKQDALTCLVQGTVCEGIAWEATI